jgi:chromosomal replication initiator protein
MQELTGRTSTQEEFFHTFNDLIEHNRQIVLTSDRAPDEIATLADRMRTRFKSGLVQDIGSPSIEMRMAILETKALQRNQKLPDDIINYLAEYCDANNYNVREMEGALKKVLFYAQIKEKLSPDITDCKDALYDAGSQKVQTTADKIIDEVCKYFSITTEEIKSRSRKKEIVEPRMIAIYLIDEKISMPLSNIALIFGQKDHTSAMHARNKITMDIKNNVPRIKRAVEDISRLVNN